MKGMPTDPKKQVHEQNYSDIIGYARRSLEITGHSNEQNTWSSFH